MRNLFCRILFIDDEKVLYESFIRIIVYFCIVKGDHFKMTKIRNIVFDFGGVLIDLDRSLTIEAMGKLGISAFDQVLVNTYACEGILGAYEKGLISTPKFRDEIRKMSCRVYLSDEEIDAAWCALLLQVPQEKKNLLLRLKKDYSIYMLSNTNELHIAYSMESCFCQDGYKVSDYFDRCFYSYKMHLSKPDPRIFYKFIEETQLKPEETLFVDDALVNVKAAQSCGWNATLYHPGNDLTAIFRNENLLP